MGKLGPNAARTEPAHWPTNERAEYPEQNRDIMLPGINSKTLVMAGQVRSVTRRNNSNSGDKNSNEIYTIHL
jgi:hypothetical protein